jgi:hypothetical protein
MFETLTLIVVVLIALNLGFVLGAFFAALLIQAKRHDLSDDPPQASDLRTADGLAAAVSSMRSEPISSPSVSVQVPRNA